METPCACLWRQSRPMQLFLVMCLAASYLPSLIGAHLMPHARSAFPSEDEVVELTRPGVSSLEHDALQFGTIIAACAKHHIACHRLRGHFTAEQPPISGRWYARENERLLMTYTTQDYGYEGTDTNPTIFVPYASSPTYQPFHAVMAPLASTP